MAARKLPMVPTVRKSGATAETADGGFSVWRANPSSGVPLNAAPRKDAALASIRLSPGKAVNRRDALAHALRSLATPFPEEAIERAIGDLEKNPDGDLYQAFIASDRTVDDYGTTFNPDGWDTKRFRRNPVVLFMHDQDDLPVGRDVGIHIVPGQALRGLVRFTPPDLYAFGDQVGRMVLGGFLNTCSIRFAPLEWKEADRELAAWQQYAIDFIRQTLLEYSITTIPGNENAMADGRALSAAGVDVDVVAKWATKVLDSRDLVPVTRATLEALARTGAVSVSQTTPSEGATQENDMAAKKKTADKRAPASPEELKKLEEEAAAAAVALADAEAAEAKAEGEDKPADPVAEEGERAPIVLICPACGYEGEDFVEKPAMEEARAALRLLSTKELEAELSKRQAATGGGVHAPAASNDDAKRKEEDAALTKRVADATAAAVVKELTKGN
jgi:hypothetical protein